MSTSGRLAQELADVSAIARIAGELIRGAGLVLQRERDIEDHHVRAGIGGGGGFACG